MAEINDGGPAFPKTYTGWDRNDIPVERGMSLRDYFAAAVLPEAFKRNSGCPITSAAVSYEFADAMLKAREAK